MADGDQNDWSSMGDTHETSPLVVNVPHPFCVVALYPAGCCFNLHYLTQHTS